MAASRWLELEREAREVRRRMADWDFIRRQPLRVRLALEYYIETGDLYVASRIAGVTVEEMNELRVRANIPNVA
ncbi:MAG: hypothetical protein DRJ56_08810 [Thermoprotei archaeon]|nr:MAG: hypothetical protein DRJ56_08810 [Thermoprotei archaeon]